jgi:hypothetical protein
MNPSAPNAQSHSSRIEALCAYYDLVLPAWWQTSTSSAVVKLRNALVHEARWGGKPLGFGHPEEPFDAIHLDLGYFNARLLMALFGEDHPYIHSALSGGAGRQLIR